MTMRQVWVFFVKSPFPVNHGLPADSAAPAENEAEVATHEQRNEATLI